MPSPLNIQMLKFKQSFQSQWNDEAKVHIAEIIQSKPFAVLSALFVTSLIVQIVSGILLSIHFSPSSAALSTEKGFLTVKKNEKILLDQEGDTLAHPGEIVFPSAGHNDVIPTTSYHSIVYISQTNPLKYIRSIHAINTHFFIAIIITILLFFGIHVKNTRYFKGLWIAMIVFSFLIAFIAWMGYILPWDQFSATSYLITQGILELGVDFSIGQPNDIIARIFSLHSIVIPLLAIAILFPISKLLSFSFRTINQTNVYTFMIFIMMIGILYEQLNPILPAAHAFIPFTSKHVPAWFFQPLHGIISFMPADLSLLIITTGIISITLLPFIQSYRLRVFALGILLALSILFSIIY
jgi:quinol-cytochrome oxidoreductase complex cytochrome b subunit